MLNALRRRWWAGKGRGALARLLAAPTPDPRVTIAEARLLALDLELTGLDPKRAEVVSVGFVPVDELRVRLAEARRFLVRPNGGVAGSAHVHQLTDRELALADPLEPALEAVVEALEGRALLVHYAALDHGVLNRLCWTHYGAPLIVPIVDTLALAYRDALRSGREPKQGSLRLPALRAEHNLPVVKLHGALGDAIATAELFLAMAARRGPETRLKDVLAG